MNYLYRLRISCLEMKMIMVDRIMIHRWHNEFSSFFYNLFNALFFSLFYHFPDAEGKKEREERKKKKKRKYFSHYRSSDNERFKTRKRGKCLSL